jgi:hypothetical protein
MLLKNKEEQHIGEVYYAKSKFDKNLKIDIDYSTKNVKSKKEIPTEITKELVEEFKQGIKEAYLKFKANNYAPKFLVTYDSFRLLSDALKELKVLEEFHIVIDEFQSIFLDSRFKADTELEFVNRIQGISKICYVSATPMMESYLKLIPEFKDLPYYELDWEKKNEDRVEIPLIIPKSYKGSVSSIAYEIISKYKDGIYERDISFDSDNNLIEVESKELVIFVNSVKNICEIIKKCELTLDNTNVLCADTDDNKLKVRKAFGVSKKDLPKDFLMQVPKEGEQHKMFTLCTKTVYLGTDFYSTNARTVVISDANIECLAVDISLDLSQILGRQRLEVNPWRNYAEFYYKIGMGISDISEEEFNNFIKKKIDATNIMLNIYNKSSDAEKDQLLPRLEKLISVNYYKDDYISIDKHSGSNKVPMLNSLVLISERRAFDIQKEDYFSRFTVMSKLRDLVKGGQSHNLLELKEFYIKFNSYNHFIDKMRFLCMVLKDADKTFESKILKIVPKEYKNYYLVLGASTLGTLCYYRNRIEEAYLAKLNKTKKLDRISEKIYEKFNVGDRISRRKIGVILKEIYDELGIVQKVIKATEIMKYFEVEEVKVTENKHRYDGFKLLSQKYPPSETR